MPSLQDDRKQLLQRVASMELERSSWQAHWAELSRFVLPRSGRFVSSDRNKGTRKHNAIHDSAATRALRVLGAGMMSGMTSPARPWFKLTLADRELAKSQAAKLWLHEITALMQTVLAKSNTYRTLQQTYEEHGVFGTSAKILDPDYQTVVHHHQLTAGEYSVATDWRGDVITLVRKFDMPVAALARQFGLANCSRAVRTLYERGHLDSWVPLVHVIEPRDDRDPKSREAKHMPWRNVYFEAGADADEVLRDGGNREMPVICSRWAVTSGDIYGHSPAMEALGDIKQLQQEQLRKGQAIDYMVRPPLRLPHSMKGQEADMLPGGVSYGDGEVQSAFQVNLRLDHLLTDIQDVRERIRSAFYVDVFLALVQADMGRMTATEVAARNEEKMLMLGPVVERLINEEQTPLIERTFGRMLAAGIVPPPPPELQGMELQVEFTGLLVQAQRSISANATDRWVGNLGQVAAFSPGVLDKFDADAWADAYAEQLGIDPHLVVPSATVALIRQQRAQAQAEERATALAKDQADTVQRLSNAPATEGTALAALVRGGGLVQTDNLSIR